MVRACKVPRGRPICNRRRHLNANEAAFVREAMQGGDEGCTDYTEPDRGIYGLVIALPVLFHICQENCSLAGRVSSII